MRRIVVRRLAQIIPLIFAVIVLNFVLIHLAPGSLFDVMTAESTGDVVLAVVAALAAEIPLALLCFWYSRTILRAFEVVVPRLDEMGYRVERHRLVPPAEVSDRQQPS